VGGCGSDTEGANFAGSEAAATGIVTARTGAETGSGAGIATLTGGAALGVAWLDAASGAILLPKMLAGEVWFGGI